MGSLAAGALTGNDLAEAVLVVAGADSRGSCGPWVASLALVAASGKSWIGLLKLLPVVTAESVKWEGAIKAEGSSKFKLVAAWVVAP